MRLVATSNQAGTAPLDLTRLQPGTQQVDVGLIQPGGLLQLKVGEIRVRTVVEPVIVERSLRRVKLAVKGGERSLRVRPDGVTLVLRGTIDCLVRRADGSMLVIEFKTGARRPVHEQQLDLYRRAAQALFPAARVEAALVYAGEG